MVEKRNICSGCKQEIDLEMCHCGDGVSGHPYYAGHTFVPMGCICGYSKEKRNDSKEEGKVDVDRSVD